MKTLGDIISEISKIQNTIDKVEVRGNENRRLVKEAYDSCAYLIASITQLAHEVQNGGNSTESSKEG